MRWVEHETGGYWDFCDFPLKDATDEMFDAFPVPNPDDFDFDLAERFCAAHSAYALYLGGPGDPDIINSNGRIMGMEDDPLFAPMLSLTVSLSRILTEEQA